MHIPMVSPKIPKGKWIKWAPPPFVEHRWFFKEWHGSSGGIIRDYKGSALVAFSTFYGPGTNTFAEARAPLFGLMLCYRLGYSKVAVESEKKEFLIASVEALDSPLYDQIFQNFLTSFHVHLSYLQGRNQSADTLATHGHFHQEHFEFLSFLMALFLLPLLPKEVSPPRLVEQSWRTNTNSKQSLGSLSLGGCSTRLTKLSIDTNNKRTSFPSTTEKRSLPPPTYSTHSILFDPIPRRWILFHYPCLEGDSVALNY
ncbi:hypothetical protein LXL04_040060 [Taraxacum kok-saghyz]